jgi:probable phosphoglycerate mutase
MSAPDQSTRYLVRHGRTRYNDEGRVQGWCDSELTDAGLEGVRATAAALADVPFVAAWSSPSGRTVATAQEILRYHPGVELTRDDDLRELGFGQWEAQPEAELWATVDPTELFAAFRTGRHGGLPGGESGADYLARLRRGFARVDAQSPAGGPVLVVSHGVTLLTHLWLRGLPVDRSLPNASVSVVEHRPDGDLARRLGWDPSGRATPGVDLPDWSRDAPARR